MKIMRAIILAGGYAKRMGRLAAEVPKSLLPVAGRPAMDYVLDRLSEVAPEKIFLTTNLRYKREFESYLSSKSLVSVELVVEQTGSEREKLGAVGALAGLVSTLKPDDYLVICGDSIFVSSLAGMLEFYGQKRAAVVAVYHQKSLEEVKLGSAVTLASDNRILSFEEKPKNPTTTVVGACIYLLPYESLLKTRQYLNMGGKKDEPGNFIAWLCLQEQVYAYMFASYIWDIGTPSCYEEIQKQFAS